MRVNQILSYVIHFHLKYLFLWEDRPQKQSLDSVLK